MYSMRAFSQFLKLDPSLVSKWFTGKRKPTVGNILVICKALGIDSQTTMILMEELIEDKKLKTSLFSKSEKLFF